MTKMDLVLISEAENGPWFECPLDFQLDTNWETSRDEDRPSRGKRMGGKAKNRAVDAAGSAKSRLYQMPPASAEAKLLKNLLRCSPRAINISGTTFDLAGSTLTDSGGGFGVLERGDMLKIVANGRTLVIQVDSVTDANNIEITVHGENGTPLAITSGDTVSLTGDIYVNDEATSYLWMRTEWAIKDEQTNRNNRIYKCVIDKWNLKFRPERAESTWSAMSVLPSDTQNNTERATPAFTDALKTVELVPQDDMLHIWTAAFGFSKELPECSFDFTSGRSKTPDLKKGLSGFGRGNQTVTIDYRVYNDDALFARYAENRTTNETGKAVSVSFLREGAGLGVYVDSVVVTEPREAQADDEIVETGKLVSQAPDDGAFSHKVCLFYNP